MSDTRDSAEPDDAAALRWDAPGIDDDEAALRWSEGDPEPSPANRRNRSRTDPARPDSSDSSDSLPDAASSHESGEAPSTVADDEETAIERDPGVSRRTTPAGEGDPDGPEPRFGAIEIVVLGLLGGIYVLMTLAWGRTALRLTGSDVGGVLDSVMYTVGAWFAVLAPGLWFTLAVWQARGRAVRLAWLAVGVLLLVPVPFLSGVFA